MDYCAQSAFQAAGSNYMNNDLLFKMLIIGDDGVGKSSLLLRCVDDEFSDCYTRTIGVNFKFRTIELDRTVIKLHMFDVNEERLPPIFTASLYRGAHMHCFIIVYDVTDIESFNNVKYWQSRIDRSSEGHVIRLLVGNKLDLKQKRVVSYKEGKELADRMGLPFVETSAKLCTNVEQAFMTMAAEMKRKFDETPKVVTTDTTTLDQP